MRACLGCGYATLRGPYCSDCASDRSLGERPGVTRWAEEEALRELRDRDLCDTRYEGTA